MSLTTAKFTINDYHRMVDAGILVDRRVELLNGEIIEMPPEGPPHAHYSNRSGKYLQRLLGDRVDVREGHPITLPNNSEPQPDLAIVEPLDEYADRHPYPENVFWIIEYAYSTLETDLEAKRRIYAESGIREYWIVNLKERKLIVFRDLVDGDYRSKAELLSGVVRPLAFPDVSVPTELRGALIEVARLIS